MIHQIKLFKPGALTPSEMAKSPSGWDFVEAATIDHFALTPMGSSTDIPATPMWTDAQYAELTTKIQRHEEELVQLQHNKQLKALQEHQEQEEAREQELQQHLIHMKLKQQEALKMMEVQRQQYQEQQHAKWLQQAAAAGAASSSAASSSAAAIPQQQQQQQNAAPPAAHAAPAPAPQRLTAHSR